VNTGRFLRLQYNGLGEPVRGELDMGYGGWMYSYYYFGPDGLPLGVVEQQFNQVDREWVYLEGEPIAQFTNGYTAAGQPVSSQVTYMHPDYLGSPRWGTNSSSQLTVNWQSDAFGMHGGEGMEGSTVMPLRLPGQIATGQGAFFLNYYRTYDAALGRYLESDPIGLEGGLNTYGYVDANPLSYTDVLGLAVDACGEDEDCIQKCLDEYYGNLVETAWDLSPFSFTSLVLDEAAEYAEGELSRQANRNRYSGARNSALGGRRGYATGRRQARLLAQFRRFNAAAAVASAGAVGFLGGAYGTCAIKCSLE